MQVVTDAQAFILAFVNNLGTRAQEIRVQAHSLGSRAGLVGNIFFFLASLAPWRF